MKNKIIKIAVSLSFLLTSCVSQPMKINMHNLYEKTAPTPSRNIAAADLNLQVTAQIETKQLCGKSFDTVIYNSSDARFSVETITVKPAGKNFGYVWPKRLVQTKPGARVAVTKATGPKTIQLQNPPMPIVPIIGMAATTEEKNKFCQSVQSYHASFSSNEVKKGRGVPSDGDWEPIDDEPVVINPGPTPTPTPTPVPTTPFNQNAFLIFYMDQYASEVATISNTYQSMGFQVQAIRVSQIPGVNTSQSLPTECAGEYMIECYHNTATDTIANVSGNGVEALKGFYKPSSSKRSNGTTSTLIPYLPGLIRAEIRRQKKVQPLAGVLLIGNSERLASFYYPLLHYGENTNDTVNFPPAYMNTDLFYIVPDPKLELMPQVHHNKPTVFKWTCRNTQTQEIKMKTYCDEIDERYWDATIPLADHRWEPRFPSSRIFKFKNINNYQISGHTLFSNYTENDVVPVGRIVTHHDQKTKDPVVARYANKIARWHNELPSFKGSSIASYGGRNEDTWTFINTDVSQFRSTYGEASPQYASQYFVPLATCQGFCTYKSAADIFTELSQSNHTSFVMTGHGAPWGNQSPYPTGYDLTDPSLNFGSENYYRLRNENIQVKLGKQYHPVSSTVKPLTNAGLIGHVVANSCDLSDINLDKGWDNSIRQLKADANQRSFAEQFIATENGGAMNTFLNSDVGYGYTDDHYNQKFMINSEIANNRCGTIGDALRLTVLDMLKGNRFNAGDWQLLNRQFLGSPVNRIALLPSSCANQGAK